MKTRRLIILLAAALIAQASQVAWAGDFLFQVPVNLDRIPKGIPQAKVMCEVFSYRDSINPIATGYSIKPINSRRGDLHQEIDVSVNFHSMSRHIKPHSYRCQIFLLTPWAQPKWQQPAIDSPVSAMQPRDKSPLVQSVSGLIE